MRLRLLFKYLNYYHCSVSILQNFHFCFSFKCTHIYPELSWQPQESRNTHCSVLLCHPSVGTWAWPPLFSYLTAHSTRNQEPHEVLSGSFYFIPSSCFLRSSPSCHFWGHSCCDMQPLNVLSVKWWNLLIATVLGWELLCLWALSPRTQNPAECPTSCASRRKYLTMSPKPWQLKTSSQYDNTIIYILSKTYYWAPDCNSGLWGTLCV